MPRTTIAADTLGATGYPELPLTANVADLAFTAADATNKNQTTFAEDLILIVRNSGAGARSFTVTSAVYLGRSGDISAYNLDAGDVAVFGPFPSAGWRQSDGMLYYEGSHAEVLIAPIRIPR